MYTWSVSLWHQQRCRDQWVAWINQWWGHLSAGQKIVASPHLPAVAESGFEEIQIAHPVGQLRDWGFSMPDGSRVHVHEYADGRRVVHRDQHDPKRSLGAALAHLFQETPYGIAIGVGLVLLAISRNG